MAYVYDVYVTEDNGSERHFEYFHRKDEPLKVGDTFTDLEREPITPYLVVRMRASVRYHNEVQAKHVL